MKTCKVCGWRGIFGMVSPLQREFCGEVICKNLCYLWFKTIVLSSWKTI